MSKCLCIKNTVDFTSTQRYNYYPQPGDKYTVVNDENKTVYFTKGDFDTYFIKLKEENPEEKKVTISSRKDDRVNHPSHYTWLKDKCGIEVIDITRHLDFNVGNAIKYLLRAGYKQEEGLSNIQKEIEDLSKALWYIQDKINYLKGKYGD